MTPAFVSCHVHVWAAERQRPERVVSCPEGRRLGEPCDIHVGPPVEQARLNAESLRSVVGGPGVRR